MKTGLLAFGFAIAALPAFAQEQTKHYNKSVFSKFHALPAVSRSGAGTVGKVQQHFPGMQASVDKLNGSFTDIFGVALAVPGATLEDKLQYLFANHLNDFGVQAGEWVQSGNVAADHASFVNYYQVINGHRVVFANLKFRFTKDGRLQRIKMNNYGTPGALAPVLSTAAAKQAAEQDLSGVAITESTVGNDWVWFPVPSHTGYTLRPAFVFNIKGEGENLPVDIEGYIDAISGQVLYRTNKVKETLNQTVQGTVYKQNPLLPATVEPLPNLKMTIGGIDYFTDTAGVLNVPSLNAPITATIKLEGKWSKVNAVVGASATTPNFQDTIAANGGTYMFPATSPSSIRHVNAYYHVNRVHDYMKGHFPTFTNMDNPLPTNVDVNGNCNAFYNGNSINFYSAGGGCNSFANCGDIIYHEYGHGISDKFYGFMGQGSMNNGALNEGNSDIWGISITNDPVLGKGSTPTGGIIRRYDLAPKVYPADIVGEVHADGEIIAGAWWDVSLNINSNDTMSMLFAKTYFDTPDGPDGQEGAVYHDVLISALMNDDNDANLNNGTPHFMQIVSAFARHGIYLLGDAEVSHSDIAHQPANTPITISATLNVTTPAFFQELRLYYKPRGGQWDSLTMTTTGGPVYTAQIPGQPFGTILDYYFGVIDNTGLLNASFPDGYKPTVASSTVTIPYQVGVGLDQKSAENFDGTITGYTLGGVLGDMATTGIWTHAAPVGSYVNPIAQSIPVQPGVDHTSGTGKCLVTGNAPSTVSGANTADVDGGRTSAITAVFSLAGFTEPIVEYWRWYSNNAGNSPGSDYWNVYIKDAASSLWIVKVDNTKATDNRWRRRIFHVNDYLPGASSIMFKFVAEDANPGSLVEAAMDDIVIYDKATTNGITDLQQTQVAIYPNPAKDEVHISLTETSEGYISLHDLTGRELSRVALGHKLSYTINTSAIPAGTYFVTVKTGTFLRAHKVSIVH